MTESPSKTNICWRIDISKADQMKPNCLVALKIKFGAKNNSLKNIQQRKKEESLNKEFFLEA